MDMFLSCDWGTSSFRLRLVKTSDLAIVAEVKNNDGIAETHRQWQLQTASTRQEFYVVKLKTSIQSLLKNLSDIPNNLPIILSGMVSSTLGMIDLPYKNLPFNLDGSDFSVESLSGIEGCNPFLIISGARTENDVIRGEETKIIGCSSFLADTDEEKLLILPGTHPKHITLKGNKVVSFKTFMTGEFFELLSQKSVLSSSVEVGGDFSDPANQQSFQNGVLESQESDLLHACFLVRTNQVLKQVPKQQNFYYLSGLLIGAELNYLPKEIPVYLVGAGIHIAYYKKALDILKIKISAEIDADEALLIGQKNILLSYLQGLAE